MKQRLDGKIIQARLVLGWEALWNAAFRSIIVLMAFAVAVLTGVVASLPDLIRYAVLAAFAGGFLWTLKSFAGFAWPGRAAAVRRIESESRLVHHPVATALDRIANPEPEPTTVAIWEAHLIRQLEKMKELRTGLPRSGWSVLDPYAVRVPVALALVASLFLYRGDPMGQLADAVRVTTSAAAVTVSLDAWIKPPAYTAKPPIMLTSQATTERLAANPELLVPENSVLTVRVHNAREPRLAFHELLPSGEAGTELKDRKDGLKADGAAAQGEIRLDRPMHVKVFDGSRELGDWQIALIPDAPPLIAFTKDPYPDSGQLALAWKASDDYGLARVTADLTLSDVQEGEIGIASSGVFLFDAPEFPIVLKKASAKEAAATSENDLTAHPWAGLTVDVTLTATDIGGRTAKSETRSVKLPEREFFKPLARALVEQRKALVMNPDETQPVERMLKGLLRYPDGLIEKSAHYIAIRTVISQLAHVESHDDIRSSIDMLWKTALNIEDGDLADARAELDALRRELERALAEGASPERIAEIMKKMRQAMDRYLEQMMAEMQKKLKDNPNLKNQRGQPSREIRPEDLQKMLDMIEKLARNGANDAAQQLLSQLENILKNLQAGIPQQMDGQRDSPLNQMLDDLSELMRRQQQLMDDTQRMPEQGDGQMGQMGEQQEGQEPGMNGQNPSPGDLADQQKALERMLQDMIGQMGKNGVQPPQALGQAGKEMRGAAGALGKGERRRALGNQGEAMNQLRLGAQGLAQQLMQQQGMGQEGNYGRRGEARGDDRDPLGRPMATQGEDRGPDRDILPSEMAIRRAREILDMLRSRSNETDIPRIERDYLERLLRGLY
jgi:uncharacterized protein (TIGR02302 family)